MTTDTYACSPDDLADAAVLVRFGCQPRLRPLQIPQYRDLLQRYGMDQDFRGAVDAGANGLDLNVMEAHTVEGLILHPREGSWLSYHLKDHPAKLGVNDRLVLGLAHVAIATRAYPTAGDLEEETVKRISLRMSTTSCDGSPPGFARRPWTRTACPCHTSDSGPPGSCTPSSRPPS